MKKLESSLKNMLLVLTGITAICVGLLAVGNELTKEPIAAANMKTLNDALKTVVPKFDNNPVEEADTIFEEVKGKQQMKFIVYPAKNNGNLVGTAVQSSALGFGGDLVVLVGFDASGNVYDYSLLSHVETPGLGSKADVWFKKDGKGDITGRNPGSAPLTVKNDGGQIDAITASTITSRAFLAAVNAAYSAYSTGSADGATSASQRAMPETDTQSAASPQTDSNSAATTQPEKTAEKDETNN